MSDYKSRVYTEHEELKEKIEKLSAFLDKGQPDNIDDEQWNLLGEQLQYMQKYEEVLAKRIELFEA